MESILLISLLTMGGLALILSCGLVIANEKLKVQKDPRVEEIAELLPNINCGACGFSGCYGYAESIVQNKIGIDICALGGREVTKKIAEIMQLEAAEKEEQIAIIGCQGGSKEAKRRFQYQGINSCRAVNLVAGGNKACIYGCLGLGDCVKVCPFKAIKMNNDCLPVVDEEICAGCGLCMKACPKTIISLISKTQEVYLGCVSQDKGKVVKESCSVGCFGCSLCASPKITPHESIVIKENLPMIVLENIRDWNILNTAITKCPAKCFRVR